jgi:hypothetical protein
MRFLLPALAVSIAIAASVPVPAFATFLPPEPFEIFVQEQCEKVSNAGALGFFHEFRFSNECESLFYGPGGDFIRTSFNRRSEENIRTCFDALTGPLYSSMRTQVIRKHRGSLDNATYATAISILVSCSFPEVVQAVNLSRDLYSACLKLDFNFSPVDCAEPLVLRGIPHLETVKKCVEMYSRAEYLPYNLYSRSDYFIGCSDEDVIQAVTREPLRFQECVERRQYVHPYLCVDEALRR